MLQSQNIKSVAKLIGSSRRMSGTLSKINNTVPSVEQKSKSIHLTSRTDYPLAAALPIPKNIDPTEMTTQFSPQRSRDISGTCISIFADQSSLGRNIDVTSEAVVHTDPHVGSYDCNGAVSLNSVMQSNVPSPFGGMNKFTHLNMPGGQWEQSSKYMAYDLQSSHYTNLRRQVREDWNDSNIQQQPSKQGISFNRNALFHNLNLFESVNGNSILTQSTRNFMLNYSNAQNDKQTESGSTDSKNEGSEKKLSRKDQLKKAVKEYGSTVIIFHVGISLMSLGTSYALVSSGLNVVGMLEYLGLGDSALASKVGTGASTFVVAYAIHKVFAPVRISITLGATPFIVRYLRKRGILKPPQK